MAPLQTPMEVDQPLPKILSLCCLYPNSIEPSQGLFTQRRLQCRNFHNHCASLSAFGTFECVYLRFTGSNDRLVATLAANSIGSAICSFLALKLDVHTDGPRPYATMRLRASLT